VGPAGEGESGLPVIRTEQSAGVLFLELKMKNAARETKKWGSQWEERTRIVSRSRRMDAYPTAADTCAADRSPISAEKTNI